LQTTFFGVNGNQISELPLQNRDFQIWLPKNTVFKCFLLSLPTDSNAISMPRSPPPPMMVFVVPELRFTRTRLRKCGVVLAT